MRRYGFTLIELLIVVAIISILAAIAVPNFLDANVRAKVAAAKNNMRVVATWLEVYQIDHNRYPIGVANFYSKIIPHGDLGWLNPPEDPFGTAILGAVTLDDRFQPQKLDPFSNESGHTYGSMGGLVYLNHHFMARLLQQPESYWDNRDPQNWTVTKKLAGGWSLSSVGPARQDYCIVNFGGQGFSFGSAGFSQDPRPERAIFREYDPTNGTVSLGRIYRTQNNPSGLGYHPQFYREDLSTEPAEGE